MRRLPPPGVEAVGAREVVARRASGGQVGAGHLVGGVLWSGVCGWVIRLGVVRRWPGRRRPHGVDGVFGRGAAVGSCGWGQAGGGQIGAGHLVWFGRVGQGSERSARGARVLWLDWA